MVENHTANRAGTDASDQQLSLGNVHKLLLGRLARELLETLLESVVFFGKTFEFVPGFEIELADVPADRLKIERSGRIGVHEVLPRKLE
jgi:hypothetical protein